MRKMPGKINYIYTFRVPPNPGLTGDDAWVAVLMVAILKMCVGYDADIPNVLKHGALTLSENEYGIFVEEMRQAVKGLLQQTSGALLQGATYGRDEIINVLVYTYNATAWVKLNITVRMG